MNIVLALFECHRSGKTREKKMILHRDLKPSNIFLDDKHNPKLGDFGFAKAISNQSMYAHTYLGTPFYMSPEQINESEYNEKSDIWSLGCIVYEMAALAPPFHADNQLALAMKIKQGVFKRLPSRYSDELMRAVRWMLKVEAVERPNVEDLLNLPHVSMRLRDRALKKNLVHMKKKEEEVRRKEEDLVKREEALIVREREVEGSEMRVEELERAVQEMQRLKKYSGSSTTAGTDLGNDSCIKGSGGAGGNGLFTSPSGGPGTNG